VRPGRLRVRASCLEQSVLFPYVESITQHTPHQKNWSKYQFRKSVSPRAAPAVVKATTHLINASARLNSSPSKAFQESFQRIVRSEQPTCGSSVTTQLASRSSNVGDNAAGDGGPGWCFSISTIGSDEFNSVLTKLTIQLMGVISIVADQILGAHRVQSSGRVCCRDVPSMCCLDRARHATLSAAIRDSSPEGA